MKKYFLISIVGIIAALFVNGCALNTPTSEVPPGAGSGSDLVISEVFHISPDKYYAYSWIELYNPTNQNIPWYRQDGSYKAWALSSAGITNTNIQALADYESTLVAGTSDGAFVSGNRGRTWFQVSSGLTNKNVKSFLVSNLNLYAGTAGGVFRAGIFDTNWTPVSTGLTNTDVRAFTALGTRIFAGTAGGGIFRSLNNGSSWTEINTGLANLDVKSMVTKGNVLFAGTSGGVFGSVDTGKNWTALNTGLTNLSINTLVYKGTMLFAGTSNGVFSSANNGIDWVSANTGLGSTDVRTLFVSGNRMFAGTSDGIYVSTDDAATWNSDNVELGDRNITSVVSIGSRLFAGTPSGVYASTTSGNNVITSTRLAVKFLARMRFYNVGNPSYILSEATGEAYFTNQHDEYQSFTSIAPDYFSEEDSIILPGQFTVIVNNEEAFKRHGELGPFNPVILEPTFPGLSIQGTVQPSVIQYMRNPLNPADNREYYLGLPAFWDLIDANEVSLLRIKDTLNILSNTNRRGDQVIDVVRFGNYSVTPDPYPGNISLPNVPEWYSVARYGGYYRTGNSSDAFYISNKPIPGWYSQIRK